MKRPFLLLVAGLTLLATLADSAQAHGRRGRVWGGVSIGIGVPLYGHAYGYGYPYAYGGWHYPGTVLIAPPPVAYAGPPLATPVPPVPKGPPDPIFYPRASQSPAQTEADRRECNRWAMTQPDALADASVFHRATLACMDGRGYTAR